jgi:hypothetical protein
VCYEKETRCLDHSPIVGLRAMASALRPFGSSARLFLRYDVPVAVSWHGHDPTPRFPNRNHAPVSSR